MAQWTSVRAALLRVCPVFLALIVWEVVSRAEVVNPRLFPAPSIVFSAFVEWYRTGDLWRDFQASYGRMLAGFAIGGAVGVGLGMLTGRNRFINGALLPILQLLRPLPPVAIIPLVIVWLGIGDTAKIFSIAFAVFFPVWINAHLGTLAVPRQYLWSAKMLSVSRWRLAAEVLFVKGGVNLDHFGGAKVDQLVKG